MTLTVVFKDVQSIETPLNENNIKRAIFVYSSTILYHKRLDRLCLKLKMLTHGIVHLHTEVGSQFVTAKIVRILTNFLNNLFIEFRGHMS